ncbi:5-formyltetrahydrofolate cyclo-ligase [Rummeliibacillus pycnus]|uniref:5-formyltetrahydrofolate cyclo-ligase n=1 Tax=Rummeliibacillus pycnus TaxID=101070 RepID=UPI000C9CF5D9|nr:5-formyltetrahydrofolate cyclo-ligase [Rummeliibacillus pycnus]
MHKKELRTIIMNDLKKITPSFYQEKSKLIHNKLLQEQAVQNANVIGITLSAFPEVETWTLIEELWTTGKKVVVPKCEPKTRSMSFYEITSFKQLENVYMHLSEPIPYLTTKVTKEQIDCLIVPGLAYDRRGFRLGFGGGYYDRFLSNFKKPTISLAFHMQVVEKIPTDDYDVAIEKIITENEIIQCK